MCRFKSGIILRNKCVVAQGENNSHSDLLSRNKTKCQRMNLKSKVTSLLRKKIISRGQR